MLRLTVIYKDPKALRPREKSPRKHPKHQIEQLKRSITEFGFVRPVLLDGSDGIIAGHGSVQAAIELGMTDIPTVRVDHLSPDQVRAYVIADNKLAENAGWDRELLALELKELALNFDITLTGFEMPEVDLLLGELDPGLDAADEIPDIGPKQRPVTRAGDLWRIADHFLLCADSTRRESYDALLQGAKAQAVFTDPPYNVRIAGNVSGLGKNVHQEFAMASGEMSKGEFTGFLTTVFGHLAESSVDGSLHYICMDWRHMREILDAGGAYSELKNLCVWAKTNAGMGSLYRSQHELVFVFKNGTASHINNVGLGRFGRNRTNVWTYAGANTFGKERDAELAMHPTVKPVALVADAILDCSRRGGIVLDAFAGSGSTLIAAEKTGRRGYGIEFEPHYVDTIIRRFEKVYGLKARHFGSGEILEDVARARAVPLETDNADQE